MLFAPGLRRPPGPRKGRAKPVNAEPPEPRDLASQLDQERRRTEALQKRLSLVTDNYTIIRHRQMAVLQTEKMEALQNLALGLSAHLARLGSFLQTNLSQAELGIEALWAQGADTRPDEAALVMIRSETQGALECLAQGLGELADLGTTLAQLEPGQDDTGPFDVAGGLRLALAVLGYRVSPGVSVHTDLDSVPPLEGASAAALTQVFVHILRNALQAVGERGDVWIGLRQEARGLLVTVEDNGPGLDEVDLARIFEPFYSTRSFGEGLGMGLSLCYLTLKRLGGDLVLTSRRQNGTRVEISLPSPQGQPS